MRTTAGKLSGIRPDGEFVSDALDMLDVIEDEHMLYSMPGVQAPRNARQ
jgi:hypothetical protein